MNYHAVKAFILNKLENELSDDLFYHGLHHTLDVLYITAELCYRERVSPYHTLLLRTAALFHDSGFTISNHDHEELSCQIAKKYLPRFDFSPKEVKAICGMIMATKIPQSPRNKLEKILCDADLDYLGRDDFYDIGHTLFEELKAYNILQTEEDWNKLQVKFLENHSFFTPTNQKRRSLRKNKYLRELREVVKNYED